MRFKKEYFKVTSRKIEKYNCIRFDADIEFYVTNCTEAQEPDAIRKAVEKFVDELKNHGGADILVESLEMSLRFDEFGPECTFNEIRNGGNAFEIEINRGGDKDLFIYIRICEHQNAPTEDDTHKETTVNQEDETMNETTTTTTTTAAVKATNTSILSIWYGNLAAYNNGALRGQWIDFEEMDRDEIEEIMNKISRNGRDECMIFDYESRCGIDVGEYASIDELFEIYEICENIIDQYGDECGEYAIKTFCDYYGAKYLTDIEHYDFYFYSECYSMTDVAYEVVDQCGYLEQIPDNLQHYFDYAAFGRDLDIEGRFNYCGGGVYCEMVG